MKHFDAQSDFFFLGFACIFLVSFLVFSFSDYSRFKRTGNICLCLCFFTFVTWGLGGSLAVAMRASAKLLSVVCGVILVLTFLYYLVACTTSSPIKRQNRFDGSHGFYWYKGSRYNRNRHDFPKPISALSKEQESQTVFLGENFDKTETSSKSSSSTNGNAKNDTINSCVVDVHVNPTHVEIDEHKQRISTQFPIPRTTNEVISESDLSQNLKKNTSSISQKQRSKMILQKSEASSSHVKKWSKGDKEPASAFKPYIDDTQNSPELQVIKKEEKNKKSPTIQVIKGKKKKIMTSVSTSSKIQQLQSMASRLLHRKFGKGKLDSQECQIPPEDISSYLEYDVDSEGWQIPPEEFFLPESTPVSTSADKPSCSKKETPQRDPTSLPVQTKISKKIETIITRQKSGGKKMLKKIVCPKKTRDEIKQSGPATSSQITARSSKKKHKAKASKVKLDPQGWQIPPENIVSPPECGLDSEGWQIPSEQIVCPKEIRDGKEQSGSTSLSKIAKSPLRKSSSKFKHDENLENIPFLDDDNSDNDHYDDDGDNNHVRKESD